MVAGGVTLKESVVSEGLVDQIAAIVGRDHVSRSDLDRRAYARDQWPLELIRSVAGGEVRHPPDVVAWPGSAEEVAALYSGMDLSRQY